MGKTLYFCKKRPAIGEDRPFGVSLKAIGTSALYQIRFHCYLAVCRMFAVMISCVLFSASDASIFTDKAKVERRRKKSYFYNDQCQETGCLLWTPFLVGTITQIFTSVNLKESVHRDIGDMPV